MTQEDFKDKYFTNNFYWVNEENYLQLQEIGIEMGCVNPNGESSLINWHEGFHNLGFRTKDGTTKFQKECFLVHNQTATNYTEMLEDYYEIGEETWTRWCNSCQMMSTFSDSNPYGTCQCS